MGAGAWRARGGQGEGSQRKKGPVGGAGQSAWQSVKYLHHPHPHHQWLEVGGKWSPLHASSASMGTSSTAKCSNSSSSSSSRESALRYCISHHVSVGRGSFRPAAHCSAANAWFEYHLLVDVAVWFKVW